MFEDKDLKVLLGNSIRLPEMDYDDEEVASELGHPVEEEALREYYDTTITKYIGKPDFRQNYLSVINYVKQFSIEAQQLVTNSIMNRIKSVYDYRPSINYPPDNYNERNEIYRLIEFIEYNHEDFIVEVWSFLRPDINSFQLEKYCEQNTLKIISEIEKKLDSQYFPWLIADFLRTYNKNDIIFWFCEKSKKLRSLILLNLYEE